MDLMLAEGGRLSSVLSGRRASPTPELWRALEVYLLFKAVYGQNAHLMIEVNDSAFQPVINSFLVLQ
jgi:hypothetical protein